MPAPSGGSEAHDVVVIGCGLMGAALARAFAKSGYSVAAWNRTPERAEALAGDGIEAVRSVVDAVRSSQLVVTCTTTYETTRSALDPVESWQGTTLVNLGTGTPDDVDEMERWAAERGISYLDGAILCYPPHIGSSGGLILFSGSPAAWSKHERTLMSLGGASTHISEQVRAAGVMEVGIVAAFYVAALSAYVESATYVLSQGVVSTEVLRAMTVSTLQTLQHTTEQAVAAIESDQHETDDATLEIYAEGSRSGLAAMRRAGHRARLLAAAVENLEAAEAAGLGKLGFFAQAKVVGSRAPDAA